MDAQGYQRKGRRWYRFLSEIAAVIHVQVFRFSDATNIEFTINWGVYVPNYKPIMDEGSDTAAPTYDDLALYGRLHDLPGKCPPSWSLAEKGTWWRRNRPAIERDAETCSVIQSQLSEHVIPLLDELSTPTGLRGFVEAHLDAGWYRPPNRTLRLVLLAVLALLLNDEQLYQRSTDDIRQLELRPDVARALDRLESFRRDGGIT